MSPEKQAYAYLAGNQDFALKVSYKTCPYLYNVDKIFLYDLYDLMRSL